MRNHFSFEIPFMRYRKVLLTISAVMSVLAIVGLIVRGVTFGIEFQGGTEIDFYDTGAITIDDMREALVRPTRRLLPSTRTPLLLPSGSLPRATT
jgi:preprotein translocase subunit SecF